MRPLATLKYQLQTGHQPANKNPQTCLDLSGCTDIQYLSGLAKANHSDRFSCFVVSIYAAGQFWLGRQIKPAVTECTAISSQNVERRMRYVVGKPTTGRSAANAGFCHDAGWLG
jgi:hypothetical protein